MLKRLIINTFFILSTFLYLTSQIASADAKSDIQFILNTQHPPKGVVFEIVEGNEAKLEVAIDQINQLISELKSRRPNIKIAIVSHGTEQFALLEKNKTEFSSTHNKVQSLVSSDIPVHVCGTHASWYNLSAKDFPNYVDVTVAGPTKIREYQREGYALIEIDI